MTKLKSAPLLEELGKTLEKDGEQRGKLIAKIKVAAHCRAAPPARRACANSA